MEQQSTARNDFAARRGGSGKLRVWYWLDDPRVTIRERLNSSGGVGYRVTLPKKLTGGRVLFLQSRDFEEAKKIARSKGREFRESRSTALILPDDKKLQAASAVRILAEHGLSLGLDEVARQYCMADSALRDTRLSLPDAAKLLAVALGLVQPIGQPLLKVLEFAVARLRPAGGTKTLAELATEMIEIKRGWHARGDLRDASIRDFENRASRISDDIGSFPLPELTKQNLYDWLHGLALAPRTKKNYRMVLAELLSYAKQKRYLVANPFEEFTRQDIKEIEGTGGEFRQPAILTPRDAKKLLTIAFKHPEWDLGAAVVLGLFGGIRTEELKRLTWDAVRLDEDQPFVVIGPEIAKKRRIRNVPLPPCAVAWLKRWPRGAKVTRSSHANDYQKHFKKLCAEAEINWDANAMRHSFGSYHYAAYGNSIETARILGHKTDDAVLFAHYRALATKEQGLAYFEIYPSVRGKVIRFPYGRSYGT
ncbi:MAG TPA: tyrosine-type recombinase/integrase [Opitutaceae bacterium]|nr:tyrosine-type recombinase/integrase [Opitutaceae bacterium]